MTPNYYNDLRAKTEEIRLKAERVFGRQFRAPKLEFSLKGRTAGRAFYSEYKINYNFQLYRENYDHFLENVVVHEFCHLAAREMHGNIKSHGPEWKKTMIQMGARPDRCHQYETKNVRQRGSHTYFCNCKEHTISTTIHNRILKGQTRTCRECKAILRKTREVITIGARKPLAWAVY